MEEPRTKAFCFEHCVRTPAEEGPLTLSAVVWVHTALVRPGLPSVTRPPPRPYNIGLLPHALRSSLRVWLEEGSKPTPSSVQATTAPSGDPKEAECRPMTARVAPYPRGWWHCPLPGQCLRFAVEGHGALSNLTHLEDRHNEQRAQKPD